MPITVTDHNSHYVFWLPSEQRHVKVGPEQLEVPLPQVPLPVRTAENEDPDNPSDQIIGSSVYEYLRRYPDCQYNNEYAELLRDAYPHYITDLASQAVMLSHKDVAAPYLQRLVNYLKILLLLDPDNFGLKQQIGLQYFSLAMNFEVLSDCRRHLVSAQHYLHSSIRDIKSDPTTVNYLAQIAYLFGDYAEATEQWASLRSRLADPELAAKIAERLAGLQNSDFPQRPLIEELEDTGEAMLRYGAGDFTQAKLLLETIEERGDLCRNFPSAEFYYLLGMCRIKTFEPAAAFESFVLALQVDPGYEPAIEAKESLLSQGG